MKKNRTYQYCMLLIGLVGAVLMSSCSGEDELPRIDGQHAIAFTPVSEEQENITRAATNLNHDFTVFGYKTVSSTPQLVFDSYAVKYSNGTAHTTESNTHNYEYVGVKGNQTIKYWDFGATEYNFWGATGGTFNGDGTKLTIDGLALTTTEPDVTEKMFSTLYHRSPVTSDVIQLQFKRPYAKVRVLFYTNATLTDNTFDNIKITGITFGPESPEKITAAGSLIITYTMSGSTSETVTVNATAQQEDPLSFGNVQLNHTHGTASNNTVLAIPTEGTEWYYTLPVSDGSPAVAFTLKATIDNEARTAVVPSNFMQWKPNFSYTYVFKVSGGKYIELYDVQIDPWKYGGSQEEEWRNW